MKKPQIWLMKSEPDVFSISDLKRQQKSIWDGVRNYQARNFMRDEMSVGDLVVFYHSNANPSGIAGLARVSKVGLADPTQFDSKSEYFDDKSTVEHPRWICVEVSYVEAFSQVISLEELRGTKALAGLELLRRGSRLSIHPVSMAHLKVILQLAQSGFKWDDPKTWQ